MFTKRVMTLCFTVIAALLLASCGQESDAPSQNDLLAEGIEVTGVPRSAICHYTGIDTLPYVEIAISDQAVETHQDHAGDLIPAPAEGCPKAAAETVPTVGGDNSSPMPQATSASSGAAIDTTNAPQCDLAEGLRTEVDQTRFIEMLDAEGLLDAFEGQSLTVFVPTNAAYDAVDAELQNEWAESMQARNSMLLYHVASGQVSAAMLAESSRVQAISGESIDVVQDVNGLLLNDSARVVEADITVCEVVIHVIDHVLIPPIFSHELPPPTNPPAPTDRPSDPPSGNTSGGSSSSGSSGGVSSGSSSSGSATTGSTSGGSSTSGSSSGSTTGGSSSSGSATTGSTSGGSSTSGSSSGSTTDGSSSSGSATTGSTSSGSSTGGSSSGGTTGGSSTGGSTTSGSTSGGSSGGSSSGGSTGGSTPPPTAPPTPVPTRQPTAVPTVPPTAVPTNPPSDDGGSDGGDGGGGGDEVVLCHKPGNKQKTISVPPDEVAGHLGHGDYLGPCQ